MIDFSPACRVFFVLSPRLAANVIMPVVNHNRASNASYSTYRIVYRNGSRGLLISTSFSVLKRLSF